MPRPVLLSVILLLSVSVSTTYPERFFGQDSTWYTPIPERPELMQDSANYVQEVYADSPVLTISYRRWSVPIWYAEPDDKIQPLVTSTSSSENAQRVMERARKYQWNTNVPIPQNAREAGYGDTVYRDNHMVIVGPTRRYAWDFFGAKRQADGSFVARRIKRWDLTGDGIEQPYLGGGCRVAPVPLLHGLITYEDVKNGRIDHALAFATHSAKPGSPGVYPCVTSNNGEGPDRWEPWLGFRFQLDPTIDVSSLGLNRAGTIIARALQEYGMIFVENNGIGNNSVYAESLLHKPGTWKGILGSLEGIPLHRMRVVEPVHPKPRQSKQNQ